MCFRNQNRRFFKLVLEENIFSHSLHALQFLVKLILQRFYICKFCRNAEIQCSKKIKSFEAEYVLYKNYFLIAFKKRCVCVKSTTVDVFRKCSALHSERTFSAWL